MIPRNPGPITTRAVEAAVATTVKAGQFVSWAASKGEARGMVVSVHKAKQVPGVPHVQEATPDAPAARVQLFAKNGKRWEATTAYLGLPVSKLTSIEPLPLVEAATEAVVAGSYDAIRAAVRNAICERIEELAGVRPDVWIYDIGSSWAVYCVGYSDDDLMMVDYAMDEASGVVVLGDPVEVRPVTMYQPVDEATEAVVEDVGSRVIEAAGVAADGGRVFRVLIIRYGVSKNNRNYPEAVLRAAAPLYEGAKAYDHHRTQTELETSTIDGLVGTFRNVSATAVGLEADLHLLPSATHAAEALDMALANQAAGLDPLIGISQDVQAAWKTVVVNGRPMQEATEITAVNSSDLVAHPAAGGQATRMVAAGDPNTNNNPLNKENHVTFKQLMALLRAAESVAQRTALLQEHAAILTAEGITADEALRVVESAKPAPTVPVATAATEATHQKAGLTGRLLVATAVTAAGLGEHMVESILGELGDQFTEADINAKVASTTRLLEHFEKQGLAPSIPAREGNVTVGADSLDKKTKRLDAMFAGNFREGYPSLKQAFLDIAPELGVRVTPGDAFSEDFNRDMLRESAVMSVRGSREAYDSSRSARARESVSTTSWGELLGDSITRRVVAEYGLPQLQSWRKIVSSVVPLNDFRTQRVGRMGGYGVLPTVAQGAPYQPLTSATDEESTYAPAKRGGTEDLTLETITNDDIRAVMNIPKKLGRAAAQTIFRFVWDFFDTNPNIYDGVALFAAGHNNTATNALSGPNLSVARKAMRKQKAYGDNYELLSLVPKFLLVCSDLEEIAFQAANSAVALPTGAPVGAASNTPNIHAAIEPIVVDYWTSITQWFTVADPALVPTIEIGFLGGQEDPALFVQNDETNGSMFNADKVTYKVRHIYGGAVLEYRGVYRGNV